MFQHHHSHTHNNLCCHLQFLEAKLCITCVCTSRAEPPLSSLHCSPPTPLAPTTTKPPSIAKAATNTRNWTEIRGSCRKALHPEVLCCRSDSIVDLQAMKHQRSFITYLGNQDSAFIFSRSRGNARFLLACCHLLTNQAPRVFITKNFISRYNVHIGTSLVAHDHRSERRRPAKDRNCVIHDTRKRYMFLALQECFCPSIFYKKEKFVQNAFGKCVRYKLCGIFTMKKDGFSTNKHILE